MGFGDLFSRFRESALATAKKAAIERLQQLQNFWSGNSQASLVDASGYFQLVRETSLVEPTLLPRLPASYVASASYEAYWDPEQVSGFHKSSPPPSFSGKLPRTFRRCITRQHTENLYLQQFLRLPDDDGPLLKCPTVSVDAHVARHCTMLYHSSYDYENRPHEGWSRERYTQCTQMLYLLQSLGCNTIWFDRATGKSLIWQDLRQSVIGMDLAVIEEAFCEHYLLRKLSTPEEVEKYKWREAYLKPKMGIAHKKIEIRELKPVMDSDRVPAFDEIGYNELFVSWHALRGSLETMPDEYASMPPYVEYVNTPNMEVFQCYLYLFYHCNRATLLHSATSPLIGKKLQLCQARAAPDQEEREDQEHLREITGAEAAIPISSLIDSLRRKEKYVREKKFESATEGRVALGSELCLSKKDIFLTQSYMEKWMSKGFLRGWGKDDSFITLPEAQQTCKTEVVRFPGLLRQYAENEIPASKQVTIRLPRPSEEKLRKKSEAGWREVKAVALDLNISCYVGEGSNMIAFCTLMHNISEDARECAQAGAYLTLGHSRAKLLTLPLVTSFLSADLFDQEAYKESMLLAVVFFGGRGIVEGTPIFGFSALEFSEYFPDSYCGITHEKDSWTEILNRNSHGKKTRFQAGFNVIQALEKEQVPATGEIPAFELEAPCRNTIVATYDSHGRVDKGVPRTQSFHIPSTSFGGNMASTVPLMRQGSGTSNRSFASSIPIRRYNPRSEHESLRIGNACAAGFSQKDFAGCQTVSCPKEVKSGTVLATINLHHLFVESNTRFSRMWQEKGYFTGDIYVKIHLASSVYSGLAFYHVLDCYSRIPSTYSGKMPGKIARQFKTFLHCLNDPDSSLYVFNVGKEIGGSLFFGDTGFAVPKLWITCATDSFVAFSKSFAFQVHFFCVPGREEVDSLEQIPYLEYPISCKALEMVDQFVSEMPFKIGANSSHSTSLAAFTPAQDGNYKVFSWFDARLAHFMNIGGDITFEAIVSSNCFIRATMRAYIWSGSTSFANLSQQPHADFEGNAVFTLPVMGPFHAYSTGGSPSLTLRIVPLCEAYSPETVDGTFHLHVRIKSIRFDENIVRSIDYGATVAWFMLENDKRADLVELLIPPRCVDLQSKDFKIHNFRSPFAMLCATSGMHHGRVKLIFQWTLSENVELGKQKGTINFSKGCGKLTDNWRGAIYHFNSLTTSHEMDFEFASFAGATISGEVNHEFQNWAYFASASGKTLSSITVSMQILPGMRFYGRSAGPF
uniref:Polyprotein n=1 Tax=Cederberg Conebush nepovirus TaxID=3115760 RepID=A0AAT9J7U6_9SECO